MPPKARRKGSGRKPLTVTNGASKQNNTIDDYFPPSPIENNNEPSDFSDAITYCNGTTLQQSSEHCKLAEVIFSPLLYRADLMRAKVQIDSHGCRLNTIA